jgi:hypothetical protein
MKIFFTGCKDIPVSNKNQALLEEYIKSELKTINPTMIYSSYAGGFVEFATDLAIELGYPITFVVPRPVKGEWGTPRIKKLSAYLKDYSYDHSFITEKSSVFTYTNIARALAMECDIAIAYKASTSVAALISKLGKSLHNIHIQYPKIVFKPASHVAGHAPFINGHLLFYPTLDSVWLPCVPWNDTLAFSGYEKDRSRINYVILESTITKKTYTMTTSSFLDIVPQLSHGAVSGKWSTARQGQHYSVVRVG